MRINRPIRVCDLISKGDVGTMRRMYVQMKVNVCADPEINIEVALGIAAPRRVSLRFSYVLSVECEKKKKQWRELLRIICPRLKSIFNDSYFTASHRRLDWWIISRLSIIRDDGVIFATSE